METLKTKVEEKPEVDNGAHSSKNATTPPSVSLKRDTATSMTTDLTRPRNPNVTSPAESQASEQAKLTVEASGRNTYSYSPLRRPGSIRLLRLMPDENESARIQCQLFDYLLQESVHQAHLYEALSYVWGSLDKPESISIDECDLPVTASLHAALLHLRDRFLERILWVDAICINQKDLKEREQQVQSMAKIYGKANRVIVWLGEAAADSHRALNEILVAANNESTTSSNNEAHQQAIFALLQRKWFRRIWVLQEVGAARHVLIMCGSTVIDGYAFCLGLQSLNLSYESCPDLQNLIRSVTYLIRGSIFRPKYATSLSGEVSLGTRPLGELIEMYHTREATDSRDKIYALLGMSSDDPSAAGLLPNYKISWGELLEQLVGFLLGGQVSVKTWVHSEMAVIKSKGCILGKVSSVDADHDDRQQVVITSKDAAGHLGPKRKWTLQPSAKSVQVDDIVCFLHGASKSTIIRLCKDHFVVVMIAVTSLEDIRTESTSVGQPEQPITSFPHDFLLVWDWERSQGKSQNGEEYETWIKSRVPNHLRTELKLSTTKWGNHSDKLTRLRNVTLILEEAEAEEGLRETMEGYERAFGKEHLHMLTLMDKLALIYRRKEQWREAEELFEQVIQTRRRVQGTDHADTLSSMDNLAATYRDHGRCTKAKLVARTDIFSREGDYSQITKEGVVQIARSFDEEEMRILLEQRAYVNAQGGIFGAAIQAALAKGEEVIVIMLLEKGVDVNVQGGIFGNALPAASAKGKEKIVATLLAKGANVNAQGRIFGNALYTATAGDFMTILLENGAGMATFIAHGNTNLECGAALLWAARNGHENVVKLLLEKGADVNAKAILGKRALLRIRFIIEPGSFNIECEMTALLWAARNGYESIVRLLLENKADVAARTCSGETALLLAALKGHEGVVRLLLEYGADVSVKDIGGRTALDLAASKGHVAVVRLLLEKELNVNMEARFGMKALQIDREHIPALEINGGFFHLTVRRGGATLRIERLKINGGFFHLTVSGGGATLLIESLEMNGGLFHSKVFGGGARLQIGSLEMNGGSFRSKASGGSAALQIGSLEMNGGSFRSKASKVVQIGSLELNGGSVKPIKRTATHRAGEEEVIVLSENQYVNTEGGLTALHLAAENGHEAVVRLFLEKGANVNTRWGKLTALRLAAHNYHNAIVQLLVENRADVDAEDDDTKRFVRECLEKGRPNANDALIQPRGTSWLPWRSSFD